MTGSRSYKCVQYGFIGISFIVRLAYFLRHVGQLMAIEHIKKLIMMCPIVLVLQPYLHCMFIKWSGREVLLTNIMVLSLAYNPPEKQINGPGTSFKWSPFYSFSPSKSC